MRVYARMSADELAQLRAAMATYGMSLSEVARAALGDWLADHESGVSWAGREPLVRGRPMALSRVTQWRDAT